MQIIGSDFIFIRNISSTNTFASELVKTGRVSEGTIIHTDYQLAGRGQPGNRWHSAKGRNLLFTVILFPRIMAGEQFFLSMAVSAGICSFLKKYIPYPQIKWPNDIYISNRKIAGILIENSLQGDMIEHSIVGIGLNINQQRFPRAIPNPISLSRVTGKKFDTDKCLREIAQSLDEKYKILQSGDKKGIYEEYISLLYRYNEWHYYRDKAGIFRGMIVSVKPSGLLVIKKEEGTLDEYSFREVDYFR